MSTAFCFWFHHLPPSSKCSYILTVSLDILGHSKSHFWDCVLCQLARKKALIGSPQYAVSGCSDWLRFKIVTIMFWKSMPAEFYSQIWWQCALLTPLVRSPQNNGMRMCLCVCVSVCVRACMCGQNEPEVCTRLAYQFILYFISVYTQACIHTHPHTIWRQRNRQG